VEFRDRGTVTDVVLTHEPFADAADRDRHTAGWNGCLDRLAQVIDTRVA